MRIAALNAGVGNVRSVVRALGHVAPQAEIELTSDPEVVRAADVLVVPGQGAFGAFAEALDRDGLRDVVLERLRAGAPYLGICLGLQILFDASDEASDARGLGFFAGRVSRLPNTDAEGRPLSLPHIGWNDVASADPVLRHHFYFAHTFAAAPRDEAIIVGTTTYGAPFVSAIRSERIFGVQFHPEKSQHAGLRLLQAWFEGLA
jgi:imidazole glycerol-phosphate synthase subunit HisH